MPPKRRQPPTRNSQRDPELRYRRDGGFVHYPGTGPNYRGKMNSAPNNSGGKNTATPDIRKAMKAAGASRCLRHTVAVQRQPATAHHLPPRVVRAEGVAAATQAQKKSKPKTTTPTKREQKRAITRDQMSQAKAAKKQKQAQAGSSASHEMSSPPSGGPAKSHSLVTPEGFLMTHTRANISPRAAKSRLWS